MVHFKLDENVPLQIGEVLKKQGFSVSSVFSERISGIKDKELLRLCIRKEFVLITLDKDFTFVNKPHEGIIVFRLKSQGVKKVLAGFQHLREKFDLQKCKGVLIIVEEDKVKIRLTESNV